MEGRAPPPPKTNPTREQIDEAAAIQRAQQAQQEILEAQEALAQLEALKSEQQLIAQSGMDLSKKYRLAKEKVAAKKQLSIQNRKNNHVQRYVTAKNTLKVLSRNNCIARTERRRQRRAATTAILEKHANVRKGEYDFVNKHFPQKNRPTHRTQKAVSHEKIRTCIKQQVRAAAPRANTRRRGPPPPPPTQLSSSLKKKNEESKSKSKQRVWSKTRAIDDIWYAVNVGAGKNILAKHDPSTFTECNDVGETLCHLACKRRHIKTLQALFECAGKEFTSLLVHSKDCDGNTPLHEAVRQGDLDTVQLLLKHGASVKVQDKSGWTPLHVCVEHQNYRLLKVLLQGKCGFY